MGITITHYRGCAPKTVGAHYTGQNIGHLSQFPYAAFFKKTKLTFVGEWGGQVDWEKLCLVSLVYRGHRTKGEVKSAKTS